MVETILEVLALVSVPLGLLVLVAAFVAFLADGRWRATTAFVDDASAGDDAPRILRWISDAGEVCSRRLADDDPLLPTGSDQRQVYYREADPGRIRAHRRNELVTTLRLVGLLLVGIGACCAIVSTAMSLLLP